MDTALDSSFTDRRRECWSLDDIRTFLEKFFIYKRDFAKICEFLPYKLVKDAVNFWYTIKKHLGLSQHEKLIREEAQEDQLKCIHKTVDRCFK